MDEWCMHKKKDKTKIYYWFDGTDIEALCSTVRTKGNCEIEKKQRSKRGKLIEEFAVRIGIEQLGTHLGQHLTSDHLQAIFECVVDSNTSVECTKLNSTASAKTENTIKYFLFL